jgi:hypothetical protein
MRRERAFPLPALKAVPWPGHLRALHPDRAGADTTVAFDSHGLRFYAKTTLT